MNSAVKVAFASGPNDLNPALIERMQALYPELPLYVVAASPLPAGIWIPYDRLHSLGENLARCRAALQGKRIRLAGVLLSPAIPYSRMPWIAFFLAPRAFLAFNEHMDWFMLRPRCLGAMLRSLRRFALQCDWRLWWLAWLAGAAGWLAAIGKGAQTPVRPPHCPCPTLSDGISVVIPSRNGAELLARLLPGLFHDLAGFASEVIVVDNGSDEPWEYPGVTVERSAQPLSFARAVNRGIRRARYRYVCLLNNDMVLEPGFFPPLRRAFDAVPDLFCATAQILFPPGVRREETGKANYGQDAPTDFPVRCDEPIPGEDLSYVLYGSGGCSLYDAAKLAALGRVDEAYEPAYVEDLDLGYRAWRCGWPTVFVAAARVEHRHRATTARYFSQAELALVLEVNYLRFLCRAVASPRVFLRLWRQAIDRLRLLGDLPALAFARQAPALAATSAGAESEEQILALGSGAVAVFPGRPAEFASTALIAGPGAPFPLSRMQQAARKQNLVLVVLTDALETPPPELLDLCVEIVLVRRIGCHADAFRAALRQTVRKWTPAIVQLESAGMAQYAPDAAPARTILVADPSVAKH